MRWRSRPAWLAGILLLALGGCTEPAPNSDAPPARTDPAPAPDAPTVVRALLDGMGGLEQLREVHVLTLSGSGVRRAAGAPQAEEDALRLVALREIIDFDEDRAAFEYMIVTGNREQARSEALTSWRGRPLGLASADGGPAQLRAPADLVSLATHDSPAWLLRRNPVRVALAAADAAARGTANLREGELAGEAAWLLDAVLDGEALTLYIARGDGLLAGWDSQDGPSGESPSRYRLGDYRAVENMQLPFTLEILREDVVQASIEYEHIALNDSAALAVFEIPEQLREQADRLVAAEGTEPPR